MVTRYEDEWLIRVNYGGDTYSCTWGGYESREAVIADIEKIIETELYWRWDAYGQTINMRCSQIAGFEVRK